MANFRSVVVAPFDIYVKRWSDAGDEPVFPSIAGDVRPTPSFVGGDDVDLSHLDTAPVGTADRDKWVRFGSDLSDSILDQGISMSRQSTDGEYRGYGAGHVNKAWVVNEDLMFSGTVADFSLEMMSLLLEDGQTVPSVAGQAGTAGAIVGVAVQTPGTGYAVGDYVAVKKTGGSGGVVRVTSITGAASTGPIGTVSIVSPGQDYTAGNTTAAALATDSTGAGQGAIFTLEVAVVGGQGAHRSLVIGRRGTTQLKKTFAFLIRGAASPYVEGDNVQIEVPRAVFNGSPNITMNRADAITCSFELKALHTERFANAAFQGYARIRSQTA